MCASTYQVCPAHHLLARLAQARRQSDELFGIVSPDAIYERPIPERHRIIFYVGHLEAFDWNLIGKFVLNLPDFDAGLAKLFAFGIDPVDGQLPHDQPADWPSREAVAGFVRRVRETLDAALLRQSFAAAAQPLLQDGYVLNVAIEHRLMHAETLAYMLHRLPLHHKRAPRDLRRIAASSEVAHQFIPIPEGTATLGLPQGARGTFGWDNEFREHAVHVPEFSVGKYKVTNGRMLAFVNDGGYRDRSLWSESDWQWKERAGIEHPQFWVRSGSRWLARTMFDEIPLPLDWPAHVSLAEARAFARGAGCALMTEAQFHRAAYGTPEGAENPFPWGNGEPSAHHGNFDFARWDPVPVNAFPAGESAFGVADLVGNGWEWTSTEFAPFAGFEAFPFYKGYSADFFDGKHFVMKGGSARTAACMLRRSFRNWFQEHYPYVYAGFRVVQEAS